MCLVRGAPAAVTDREWISVVSPACLAAYKKNNMWFNSSKACSEKGAAYTY